MKFHYLLAFLLLVTFANNISAQELYHRVRVDLHDKDITKLAALGVETDHGHLALGRYLENDFSEKEIQSIKDAGFKTKILISDVSSFYAKQLGESLTKVPNGLCFDGTAYSNYVTPDNFTLGSMGGYYTYEEMLDILDDMYIKYPNLISVKSQISDFETHEGRPIYSLVISDNPGDLSEDEPQTLYTALHHAREPNSLMQTIYYMWYLLENYESDPIIKEIVDNTQLHFIPCINPDGYIYNQTIAPEGGGLWRKNRRDNGDGTFGVDLNRNYGFEWGFNDIGSSPDTGNDTYRGPAPFSEPETQAVKYYAENHNFQFALNYHTFGNLLIYPWGYNDSPTPESNYFQAIAKELTKLNNYVSGTGIETVGYNVNGVSDDWMYGEQTTKNRIYSMTPEAGLGGFWPPMTEILDFCQANVQANISTAAFLLNYPVLDVSQPVFDNSLEGSLTYSVTQLGLQASSFEVEVSPISDNVTVGSTINYNLELLEEDDATINFELDSDISFGDVVEILVESSGQVPLRSDTVRFTYIDGGSVNVIVQEEFGEDLLWEADNIDWFYSTDEFTSPEYSLTESNGIYPPNQNKAIFSKLVSLPDEDFVQVSFDLKVDIEKGYDFAQLSIITNGSDPVALCGSYSSEGTNDQIQGEPLYDGEFGWVREEIDISEYADKTVRFLWQFQSDGFVEGDGFYVDDWSIATVNNSVNNKESFLGQIRAYPNPTSDVIKLDMPYNQIKLVQLVNTTGQVVKQLAGRTNVWYVGDLTAGLYRIVIYQDSGEISMSTMIKMD